MIVHVDRKAFVPLKELHPCPKPLEEMRFMIEALTKPGQIVLDPFCGLGGTLLAAQQLGRRWLACDLSNRYGQIAMARLDDLRRFGPERPCEDNKAWFVPGGNPEGQSYQTPPRMFNLLHSIFQFTVDAAASKSNALLPRCWIVEQDALHQDWSQEIVFCNPPFNNIAPFLVKARTAKKALVLVPLNFLTSVSFLGESADYIIIPKGRIKYFTANRKKVQPILGTCFLVYGKLSHTEAVAITNRGWQYFVNHEAVA